ncbi:MAG: hypothetical protein RLZZ330_388 [Actinomycetota bacterium]
MVETREYADIENRIASLLDSQSRVVVCIDGPAGSGKTTLANRLSARFQNSNLVHADDLYAGWDTPISAEFAARVIRQIVNPHLSGEQSNYSVYNWSEKSFNERKFLTPKPLLILEGVGVGMGSIRKFSDLLTFIDIDQTTGLHRVLARDGISISSEMVNWQEMEQIHFEADKTKKAADFVIDGSL